MSPVPTPPTGPIATRAPGGGSFGISWDTINQYDEAIQIACDEFGVPFGRLKGVVPIESRGEATAVQENPRNGNSYGLCQVVPYAAPGTGWAGHSATVIRLAGLPSTASSRKVINALYDPGINLRVAASILKGAYDRYKSWDAANSAFFTGKPDWLGSDSVNQTTGAQYRDSLNGLLEEIWRAADIDGTTPPSPESVPWPAGFDRRIVQKPPSGNGWDALGSRTAQMCATVCHITDGNDNRDAIVNLFGPGGGRYYNALTDAVIDRTGKGYLMNDPWSADPMEGSGRTPWASGGNRATGPGVAFLQTLGAYANNHRGFSTEHCNKDGQGFTDAQLLLSHKVHAVAITREGITWDSWPINQHNGLYVALKHRDFTTQKSCPGSVWNQAFHDRWVQGVAAEAKLLQTGSLPDTPIPVPPPDPEPAPERFTRFGMNLDQIQYYFGTMTRVNPDGTATELAFNPNGALSLLWLERCGTLGIFPESEELRSFDSALHTGKEWFASWEGGWTAWLPVDNERAGWRWLDRTETPA